MSTTPAIIGALVAIAVLGGAAIYLTTVETPNTPAPAVPTATPTTPEPVDPVVQDPQVAPDPPRQDPDGASGTVTPNIPDNGAGLVKFGSFAEYAEYLSEYKDHDPYYYHHGVPMFDGMMRDSRMEDSIMLQGDSFSASAKSAGAPSYSTTNVQIAGVDEPDFVKNDGRHIYAIKHNRLAIIDTQAADPARAATMITLDIPPLVQKYDMLVDGNRLVVLYHLATYNQAGGIEDYTAHALVLDISDRRSAEPVREFTIPGRLETGRMVGGHAYVIASMMPDYDDPAIPALRLDGETVQETPVYRPAEEGASSEHPPHLVTVMAFEIRSDKSNSVAFLMDPAGTTFMSHTGLYLTANAHGGDGWAAFHIVSQLLGAIIESFDEPYRTDLAGELDAVRGYDEYDEDIVDELVESILSAYIGSSPDARAEANVAVVGQLSKIASDIGLSTEVTEIYRIGVDGTDFELAARGTVPGHLLNQFSMDERNGELRVATTINGRLSTFNNVFVLDSSLYASGALTGIAPDEDIYSARFVGDRLYLVTFRQIDPFFVIDLSGDDPSILGELKMPGYSSYLHFYDESTVIGIGREGGVKIAMFDISDIRRPLLADSIVLDNGRGWTQSPAEYDHKALLVSHEHELLSIPVYRYGFYCDPNNYCGDMDELARLVKPDPSVTELVWPYEERAGTLGFLIYQIRPADGFELEQYIEHELRHDTDADYARSLYIGDTIYTVSESALTLSPVDGAGQITKIPLDLGER